MKKYLIASILIVGFAGSAYAVTGQFGDMCSWGLANHKDVQTDCSVNATIKGKTYCFSSADAKSQFMKNPSGNLTKADPSIRVSIRARPGDSSVENLPRGRSQLKI